MKGIFSKEYFFKQSRKNGYTLKVKFRSDTESSNMANSILVVGLKVKKKKLLKLVENVFSEPKVNTFGIIIRCIPYFEDSLNNHQKIYFKKTGFHTNEISDVIILQKSEELFLFQSGIPAVTLVV